jgi:chromosome partitioning protein
LQLYIVLIIYNIFNYLLLQKQLNSAIIITNNIEYIKGVLLMAVVISVALQKGGVGKSTTSQALASTLGFKKKRVLLIDMDSQGNVTYSSGVDSPQYSITDVLGEDCRTDEALIHCKYYDLLAADSYLTNVEMAEGVESTLLKNAIEPIKSNYDFIIIDTPPALGNLSFNSLVASDYVVIPTEPRPFALQGLGALHNTIESVRNSQNPTLKVLGILLIKYSNRTVLNRDIKDMIEEFAKQMNTIVFDTTIREGIAVPEAQTVRQPLIDYAKSSKPNIDYKAFTTELLKKIGE